MNRILFVDDEARILDGIRRSMYCMREEWHMRFANGGPAALQALSEEPADVVVSDMRMPGMDGAQLLSQVMRLYPGAVRIILSGQAEHESIVRATRAAHRYLSKPCDALELKAAITRTTDLRSILSDDRLAAIVGSVEALPSPPKTYQALLAALRDPAARLETIIDIIEGDAAMASKVVKLANSGFFGIRNPVQTIARAVGLVGFDAISTLVLGQHLFGTDRPVAFPGFALDRLSRHSFEVAAWARAVALHEGFSSALADAAFLAGLLHDVGQLVFATRSPPTRASEHTTWVSQTREQLKAHHAEVGGYLLGLWGFTDAIVEAIVYHHTPSRAGETRLGLSGLVHIADLLDHASQPAEEDTGERSADVGYLLTLGLTEHWADWQGLRSARREDEAAA